MTDKKRGYRYPHCKMCAAKQQRDRRNTDLDAYNAYQRDYFARTRETRLPQARVANLRAYYRLKDEVFNLLEGSCRRCGHKDWGVLQIDHVLGGGGKERDEIGYSQTLRKMRDELKSGEGRDRYQLLCANCHHRKSKASSMR